MQKRKNEKNVFNIKKQETLLYGMFFGLILFCNILTRYAVDDYTYAFSFATREPLENIWEIFPSMIAHAHRMNGRLTAHFLVQLFMLMPKWVFDIINSGMFCVQIALICGFGFTKQRSNLATAAVFCGFWMWQLAFGQVNLWQDGAINYLWSIVFVLLFIFPFAKQLVVGAEIPTRMWKRVVFFVFAFLVGSYSETASAAGIFVVAVLTVLDALCNHRHISKYGISCVAIAVIGYLTIFLAPGEWENKGGQLTLLGLFQKFEKVTVLYASSFGVLACVFAVLLVINLYSSKRSLKKVFLSITLVLGSLAANYIMIFADSYPERSSAAAFALLITAVAVLLPLAMEEMQWKIVTACAIAVLITATLPNLVYGIKDIGVSHYLMQKNERIITESIAKGESEAKLAMIYPGTKYSAIYDLKYLDVEDSKSWPNSGMAKYYGINTIIGLP